MSRAFKLALPVALVLLLAVAGVVAAGAAAARATPPRAASPSADTSKAYKIGISQIVTHPALDATVNGFKDALTEAGYTNVTYDLQNAEGDMATTASIAQKFAGDGLDLVLGVATPTAQALAEGHHRQAGSCSLPSPTPSARVW